MNRKNSNTLEVSELFYSIQGESSYAGYPCLFIRLSGCNLRCSYCDARYTYEEKARRMTIADILAYIQESPVSLVEITGGEPLLQDKVYDLMKELLADERIVLLETNGSMDLGRVPTEVVKIMDIKCPGSSMADHNLLANLQHLTSGDELKFVLCSREDYLWAVDFLKKNIITPFPSSSQRPKILFSPVTRDLSPTELAGWILKDRLPIRLQLQLHTLLWPGETRGV